MARGGFESVIRKGRWNEVFEAMPRDLQWKRKRKRYVNQDVEVFRRQIQPYEEYLRSLPPSADMF